MLLRYLLLYSLILGCLPMHAQEARRYLEPEYKIRYRDTVGTFLQVQNYFDRTYYKHELYFRIKKGGDYYGESLLPDSNGLSKIVETIDKKADLRINKCFEIKGIKIKGNKVNIVGIREEKGALSLIMKDVQRFDTGTIDVMVIKDKDTTMGTLPYAHLFPMGLYRVVINTIPKYQFKFYSQPAEIKQKNISEPVFFDIKNEDKFAEIKMEVASYPYKKFYPCYTKEFNGSFDKIKIMPKRLYKIQYRKIGKRRFKKFVFYARPRTFQNRTIE